MSQKNTKKTIFHTNPTKGGHTWSITTKLGNILNYLETRYGLRDGKYTILGIEMTSNKNPQIWFPGDREYIQIQITENCLYDLNEAIYQVAHEAVHCLDPCSKDDCSFLEEGFAVYFAIEYCKINSIKENFEFTDKRYEIAYKLVSALIQAEPNAVKLILEHYSLSGINFNELKKIIPLVCDRDCQLLVSKFYDPAAMALS